MKYIKVEHEVLWGTDQMTGADLFRCREGIYNTIINIKEKSHFSAKENKWLPIRMTKKSKMEPSVPVTWRGKTGVFIGKDEDLNKRIAAIEKEMDEKESLPEV